MLTFTHLQPPRHRPSRDTTLHYIASIHSPEAVPMFLRLWTNISSVIQYLWEMVVLIEGFQATSYLVGSRLTFLKTRKLNTSSAQDSWRMAAAGCGISRPMTQQQSAASLSRARVQHRFQYFRYFNRWIVVNSAGQHWSRMMGWCGTRRWQWPVVAAPLPVSTLHLTLIRSYFCTQLQNMPQIRFEDMH